MVGNGVRESTEPSLLSVGCALRPAHHRGRRRPADAAESARCGAGPRTHTHTVARAQTDAHPQAVRTIPLDLHRLNALGSLGSLSRGGAKQALRGRRPAQRALAEH